MTIAPFTPFSTHSRMSPGAVAAGVTSTARSRSTGTSPTVGYARMPSTLSRFGFTGKTVPPNCVWTMFHSTVRPTLPGFSVAPITATFLGLKIASSARRPS